MTCEVCGDPPMSDPVPLGQGPPIYLCLRCMVETKAVLQEIMENMGPDGTAIIRAQSYD